MMQGLGTSWMITEPTDTPIEKMSIEEVKAYMCPKSNGSTIACGSCAGFKTCPAGQRAVRLVGERQSVEDEREEFRKACESGNARDYLMKSRAIGKNAAADLLSRLVKKYPGISADYGGSRRIIRNCTVKKPEEPPKETPKETPKELSFQQKGGLVMRERAMAEAKAAFESGDPVAFLVNAGAEYKNARLRVSRWIKSYPDIVGDYRPEDKRRKKAEEPKTETKPETEPVDNSEDEVSLEDFLAEFETPQEAKNEGKQGGTLLELAERTLGELKAEKAALLADIQKAEERIRCIDQQQAALEMTIAAFQNTETGK